MPRVGKTMDRKRTLRRMAETSAEPMTEECSTVADPWRDASSYSPGERGTREPSVWELQIMAGVRVTVHRCARFTPATPTRCLSGCNR